MSKKAVCAQDLLPPQDLEAEQATLGAALIDDGAVARARAIVAPDAFYREAHQEIFAAVCRLDDEAAPVDVVTVGAELRRRGRLAAVGGAEYLTALIGEVPTSAHVIRYATIVHECALRRKLLRLTERIQESIYERSEPLVGVAAQYAEALAQVQRDASATEGPGYTTAAAAAAFIDDIRWTWRPWMPDGFLTMMVGETGIGKSKLALRMVQSVVTPREWPDGAPGPAAAGKALYIDTESAQAMHLQRMRAAGLPMDRVYLPGTQADAHLDLSDSRTLRFVRHLHERETLSLVVIDSLRSGMPGDENSSEFGERLGPWARLACELAAPVVIVHHANKRANGAAITLERLRGSSAIAALPRSIIAVDGACPGADTVRVHSLKCNFARPPEPFALRITEHGCEPTALPDAPRRDHVQAEAEQFLVALLHGGAVAASEVHSEARARGISTGTLARARQALAIAVLPDPGDGRKTLWQLPRQGAGQ